MPPRRNKQPKLEDVVGIGAEFFADRIFERLADVVDNVRTKQVSQLTPEARDQLFDCAACRKPFALNDMEMINPHGQVNPETGHTYGTCRKCFAFLWTTGEEKLRAIGAQQAARAAAAVAQGAANWAKGPPPGGTSGPRPGPRPAPAGPQLRRPWDTLGVSQDATLEEVKKAYRRLAAQTHPDTCPPGTPHEQVAAARDKFEELTRAYKAMEKVRQVAK
jgi:hypothetical protein